MAARDSSGSPDARAQARARLEARQARLHTEEGGRAPHQPASGSRPPRPSRESRTHTPVAGAGGAPPRERVERSERTHASRRAAAARRTAPAGGKAEAARNVFGSVARAVGGLFAAVRDAVAGLIGRNPRLALIAAGAAVLVILVIVIATTVRGCAADGGEQPAAPPQQQPAEENPAPAAADIVLPEGLDTDLASALLDAAAADPEIARIAARAADYGMDGEAVQYKLLNLAVNEVAAISFVRDFPDKYPAEGQDLSAAAVDGERQGGAPKLHQWDPRWGYTVYSSTTFALTGCCPTSLAMVYQGLTGNSDKTPYDMGVLANEMGYETEYSGTDPTFLTQAAAGLGLSCEPIAIDAGAVTDALSGGALVICSVGPGDFTTSGHFIVLSGLSDDGRLLVNDPVSATRTAQTWDIDQVLNQSDGLFAYRA